jgi:hypothetical protein
MMPLKKHKVPELTNSIDLTKQIRDKLKELYPKSNIEEIEIQTTPFGPDMFIIEIDGAKGKTYIITIQEAEY